MKLIVGNFRRTTRAYIRGGRKYTEGVVRNLEEAAVISQVYTAVLYVRARILYWVPGMNYD